MVTGKELLTTYWAQLTFVLLGLGVLIKAAIDHRARKKEINLEIFQRHRLDAVNAFFRSYNDAQHFYHSLPIFDVINVKYTAKEMDEMINPILQNLRTNCSELKIYFDNKISKDFDEVSNNIEKINNTLRSLYFDYDEKVTVSNKSNMYGSAKSDAFKANDEIINELTSKIRKVYAV